ncbi:MAG TPA: tetratricopeptide repeat-containing glycosyltransferase family protein [Gemmatimonadaceae bacterium]|nr:tetratricopeptide repeat-containing glycosyltransferase family protein [Gemmatimonadaceae bacterium]
MPRTKRNAAPDELWQQAAEALRRGDLDAAESRARTLRARNPRHAGALHALGLIEFQRGRAAEAVPLLREALRFGPADPAAHFNLGIALHQLGDSTAAVASYRQAIALRPDFADAWSALSASLLAASAFAEAADSARRALAFTPNLVAASANLSLALKALGDERGALEIILACVRTNPTSGEAWFWMGQTLHLRGEVAAAIPAYEKAVALEPGHVLAHARLGAARLLRGDFAGGWPEYEWRLRSPGANPHRLAHPRWNGEALTGRTILLRAEQGLGDAIQMLRYVEPVAAAAGGVLVEVGAALLPLVPARPNVTAIERGAPLPAFDVYCPLFSLPLAFGTTLDTIPNQPYLRADPSRAQAWRAMIPPAGRGRRIGLVWAGSRHHQHDRERSLAFADLTPLIARPEIAWFSLQVGAASAEARDSGITDLGPRLRDFGETAAAISHLDLVITVDTSVAHLAGALGVPVWILLPHIPDWRWLLDREDSPWYPSARLFREPTPGDWRAVVDTVGRALAALV